MEVKRKISFDECMVEDLKEKERIEKVWGGSKLKLGDFKVFNTSWATDKHGDRDGTNLACFVEFITREGRKLYWLPKEFEPMTLEDVFGQVKQHNMSRDSQGREYSSKLIQPSRGTQKKLEDW